LFEATKPSGEPANTVLPDIAVTPQTFLYAKNLPQNTKHQH